RDERRAPDCGADHRPRRRRRARAAGRVRARAGGARAPRAGAAARGAGVRRIPVLLALASLATPAGAAVAEVARPAARPRLAAVGDRWRSPPSEAIYGLTERLRDSPPIADGVVDIPTDDAKPPQVGSLDRRGETVAMYVRPTFSLYAPFYQSSRGYGLAVAGTTVGLFDVAKSDPRALAFRFETGATP